MMGKFNVIGVGMHLPFTPPSKVYPEVGEADGNTHVVDPSSSD